MVKFNLYLKGITESTPDADILQLYQSLHKTPDIDFSHHGLRGLDHDTLLKVLDLLPSHIEAINLTHNNLFELPTHELCELLNRLPANLLELDISHNTPNTQTPIQNFAAFTHALPRQLRYLNLSNNALGRMPSEALFEGLSQLPTTLHELVLKGNHLDELPAPDLASLFERLGNNLCSLNLVGNQLSRFEMYAVGRAIDKLPPSLKFLNLSYNGYNRHEEALSSPIQTKLAERGVMGIFNHKGTASVKPYHSAQFFKKEPLGKEPPPRTPHKTR